MTGPVAEANRQQKVMKCKFLCGGLAVALAVPAAGATADFFQNDALIICPPQVPPQVDATNFVNHNFFSINFTSLTFNAQTYRTANTLNFTNTGLIVGNSGFEFNTGPVATGQRRMAANFRNSGTISAGSALNTNVFGAFFFGATFLPKLTISATNVMLNSSTNIVGVNGLFAANGRNLDLSRANIAMEGFENFANSQFFFSSFDGIFDGYWGVGTNLMNPFVQFEISPPQTPFHLVTTAGGGFLFQVLSLPAATAYVTEAIFGTNRFVQACFLSDTNDAVLNNVYFPFLGEIVVEWQGLYTNVAGATLTNYLYLLDDFGSGLTNSLVSRGLVSAVPTLIPRNYSFIRGGPFNFGTPAAPGLPGGTFDFLTVTNEWAAYEAIFAPTTQVPGAIPGQVITNLPGRIEIVAEEVLDLTRARITGLNYLRLRSTNHFAGSSRAAISVPYSDISLATTNGQLTITNLVAPEIPRFIGSCDLWSGRWTNDANGFRSEYHVLFVDSRLSPTAPAQVQDLYLRSTNVVISDILNVGRSFLIDAERITVTSNQPPANPPFGEINLLSSQITWSTSTPRLQYLTNAGNILSLNAVFFGGSRTSPYYTSNYNEPYLAFVNSGTVTTEGSLIWADYFENSGLFTSGLGFGSIELESQVANLRTNGSFIAPNGDISITTGELIVTNHLLHAGRTLTLSVANLLTDTGVSNANSWAVGRGINLPRKPASGDLLGTTILNTAPPDAEVPHLWAADDRGCEPAGFLNNAALGRLILDGGDQSLFRFTAAGGGNALYVDYLEFRNFTTNINGVGDIEGVQIDPGMKIYYAQAMAGGISVAERISGANAGRFCWVSDYAGIYSSTNVISQDGTTNTVNTALRQSANLDSDGDGIVNLDDPFPFFTAQDLALTVAVTNQPSPGALVSWRTIPYSTNAVYVKSAPMAAEWQLLTNFVSGGPISGRVSVFDPMMLNGARFYRVQVNAPR